MLRALGTPTRYDASWSLVTRRIGKIRLEGVVALVDYGRKKRGKTGERYVAAKEHALHSQVSIFHRIRLRTVHTAVIQHFKSINASRISRQSSLELLLIIPSLEFLSLLSLRRAILFSRWSRNLAMLGLSGIWYQAIIATTTLGNPSTRNKSLHDEIWTWFATFVTSHARLLANEVARGAADMKRPVRKANSSRLKKNERRKGIPGENAASPTPRRARRTSMEENEFATACRHAARLHDSVAIEM